MGMGADMTMTDQHGPTITDADREAAAEYLPLADEECGEIERGLMRAGEMDTHWLVQAFARHRALGRSEGAKAMQDAERLDFLADMTLDLRCINVPTGGDDYTVGWQVIQHYMASPRERIVGEADESEGPRVAIDRAIAALDPAAIGKEG